MVNNNNSNNNNLMNRDDIEKAALHSRRLNTRSLEERKESISLHVPTFPPPILKIPRRVSGGDKGV